MENAPLPLHGEHGLLHAAALALTRRERLGLQPDPFRVAREHALDVARPQRCLVAADTLADLHDHVLLVGRIPFDERKRQLALEPLELAFELRDHRRELGIVARDVQALARLSPRVCETLRRLELLEPPARVRSLTVVVVDRRIGQALLRLRVGAVELVDEALDGHRRRVPRPYASEASTVISGTEASAFETGQFSTAVWAA